MKNSNRLIAEFMMGREVEDGLNPPMMAYLDNEGDYHHKEDLRYHTSWDWLMPVVQKCYNNEADTRGVKARKLRAFSPYPSDAFDNLVDAVATLDMHNTYVAVVEFIKQQNKNKKA
jgi:hypothetical protein